MQIIQSESLKRRWLILGLILATGALTAALILLSTSYALYARTKAMKEQVAQQNDALTLRAYELQTTLDVRTARDGDQARARTETLGILKKLLPAITGNSDVSAEEGGKFAQAVYSLGGRFETESKPSDKLFRNWKVNTDSGAEVYSLVGGFVEGKWVIHSNLVSRKRENAAPLAGNE